MIEQKEVDNPPPPAGSDAKTTPLTNGRPQLPPGHEVKALPAPAPASPPKRRRWAGLLWLVLLSGIAYAGYRYYRSSEEKKAAAQRAQAERLAHRPVSIAATAVRHADI